MTISPEESRRLDDLDIMFQTAGWKELIKDVEEKKEILKDRGFRSTDLRLLGFYQGQYVGLEYITGLQTMIEQIRMQNMLQTTVDSGAL